MLGNQSVYSEEYSVIGNPFDARMSLTSAQMLRLYLLNALVLYSGNRSFRYLAGHEVRENFRKIGFGDDVCIHVLKDLCANRFIFTSSHSEASFEANYAPSRLGGFVVRNLISQLAYVENVMMDTFIADEEAWTKIKATTEEVYSERDVVRRLEKRIQRARSFYEYIEDLYAPLRGESIRRGLSAEWCGNPLEEMKADFERNTDYALKSAKRNYRSGATKKQ